MASILDQMQGLSLSSESEAATPAKAHAASMTTTQPPGSDAAQLVAGGGAALAALRELIAWPQLHRDEGQRLGVVWPKGLLLHGPPGCGKTLLVQAVAKECGAVLHQVTAGQVYGAYVGQSERQLREAFESAARDVEQGKVAVIFLDEVDALCPRRDHQRSHESRVVAQLLTLMDGAGSGAMQSQQQPALPATGGSTAKKRGHLVVVGATNRPGALDPALRRPGRLDREICVSVPDAVQRAAILSLHTQGLQLAADVDMASIAASCHGYSGADLAALAREAALVALSAAAQPYLLPRPSPQADDHTGSALQQPSSVADPGPASSNGHGDASGGVGGVDGLVVVVAASHFAAGMRRVGPSIVRGAEVEVPQYSWDDIGGIPEVKKRLQQSVEWPLKHRDAFQRLGMTPPRGVLLYGPPGCSKTSLARAAAAASGATLLPLSCAQLFSMYVGEGEAQLRDIFQRARLAAPSIVLLDEIDAVAARRVEGGEGEGGGEAGVRLLTTLLTEMDGMEEITGVLVLGATNRPAAVDAALLRPGRFDTLLYVPPPDEPGRKQVLELHTRGMPLAADVDLAAVAADTAGFTGAELAGLCREAALAALREDFESASEVADRHFKAARASSRAPSLSPLTIAALENWAKGRAGR